MLTATNKIDTNNTIKRLLDPDIPFDEEDAKIIINLMKNTNAEQIGHFKLKKQHFKNEYGSILITNLGERKATKTAEHIEHPEYCIIYSDDNSKIYFGYITREKSPINWKTFYNFATNIEIIKLFFYWLYSLLFSKSKFIISVQKTIVNITEGHNVGKKHIIGDKFLYYIKKL